MRICFISFEYPPKIIGGMGTYAEQLIEGLEEKGIDTYVITFGDKNYYDKKVCRISVPNVLYWRRLFFISSAFDSFRIINKKFKFDLIHLNGTYPIVRSPRLPVVSTLHALPNFRQARLALKFLRSHMTRGDIAYLLLKNPVGSIFDVTTAQASDRIICPSPGLARDIMSYCFAQRQKIRVIQNGINLKKLDETECSGVSLLDDYHIQKDNFLLYMGRLSLIKGVQYLIEAFRIVQKRHPNLQLVIAGNGEFEQHLRKLASKTKNIIFLGYVESIKEKKLLYNACIGVVLPSSAYEVLPMTILEGMANCKPIIASDIEGNAFLVKHGKNGFLSKPRDPEDLANLINLLCEDRVLARKMGQLGRRMVESEYTVSTMVDKTLKTYKSLLC